MYKLYSVYLADNIKLNEVKSKISGTLIVQTISELFYKIDEDKYLSIYNHGAIAFINFSTKEISDLIEVIRDYTDNLQDIDARSFDSIDINLDKNNKISFKDPVLEVPDLPNKNSLFRIIMFDITQSISLDYYSKIGEALLDRMKLLSKQLEENGKFKVSKKEMMKFIGKSLNTKNNIVDTFYIFDSPDLAWEDDEIDKIHKYLSHLFDLNSRYREIENIFKVIDNNLEIYNDIYQHKESANLEIVVIILIIIEIIKAFI